MEVLTALWLCGSIAGTSYLCLSYDTSFAFDRPLYLAISSLAITGFLNVVLSLFRDRLNIRTSKSDSQEYLLPEIHPPHSARKHDRSRNPSPAPFVSTEHERPTSKRRLRATFVVLVAVICVRVELARWIVRYDQCARESWVPLVPAILILYDAWSTTSPLPESPRAPERQSRVQSYIQRIFQGRARYVPAASLIAIATSMIVSGTRAQASTFICRISGPFYAVIPLLQAAGSVLDLTALIAAVNLIFRSTSGSGVQPARAASVIGWLFLFSCTIIVLASSVMPLYRRDQENWRNVLPRIYVPDALKLACAFAFTVTCIVQAACSMGVRLTTYLVPFFAINLIAMQAAKRHRSPFPPMSNTYILSALAIATLGFVFAARSEATLHKSTRSRSASDLIGAPKRVIALLLVLFAAQCGFWLTRQRMDPSLHPIQELITSAEDRHAVWFEQAGSSRSLSEAAATYRDRYGGDPPPGYDRWFNYATLNSALVVDDFDSIHEDLLPFWSVKPENIRERTWRLMSNPWNFAGGILIRKGKVSISPQVADTHRWMLEGVQEMIRPFAKWLPDMDIAINMNDECRVAVPFQDMENMREEGRNAFGSSDQKSTTSFSDDRATTWQTIPEEPIDDTDLVEVSLVNSFHHFGSVGCSPSSKARQERHWEVRSQCSSCAAPHSYYQFVDDWIQAASPCHQPDVGDLHGLHASPADFKGSNELLPIFSQSKAVGYNDILYPSAWNYRDKIMYDPNEEFPDPDFLDKDTTLFWRGASSEGRSVGNGAWRGMSRQRLVHLFENATSHDRYMVLLPDAPSETPTYSYHNLAPKDLHVQATTDTRFVDHIERCAHADCDEQAIEFRPEYVQPSEFQSHWRYKYLFDVDGAGFSGRFLPFLASKSLPFKASLMREWWDSRLTPWKHFIPVDIRMTEAWSLLAYFAGWKSPGMGEDEWLMEPHHEEAERIALEGREWVDRVLRKEDMEIYLFRLLLEWGRVTDDARETLGFRADLPEE